MIHEAVEHSAGEYAAKSSSLKHESCIVVNFHERKFTKIIKFVAVKNYMI